MQRTMRSSTGLLVILAFLSVAQVGAAGIPDNPPGWAWLVEPRPPTSMSWSIRGILGLTGPSQDGGLDVVVAMEPAEGSSYRVIAFDAEGARHELHGMGSSSGRLSLNRFISSSATLPFSAVASFGIEVLSPEGWTAASAAASVEAAAAGVHTLPLPVVGQPYAFELLGVDGRTIRSERLLGQVVIVDCWATWCTPCMKKMPALKAMHDRWRGDGLAVIGVNFDQDTGKARSVIEDLQLPWPQVAVPPDLESHRLWWEVSSISSLPRLFVVDRGGVLVADLTDPEELEVTLAGLFAEEGHSAATPD
jgi:thiol-disulfide isomerase/thioredoxin